MEHFIGDRQSGFLDFFQYVIFVLVMPIKVERLMFAVSMICETVIWSKEKSSNRVKNA